MADDRKIVKCKGCGADIFFEQGIPWFSKNVPIMREVDEKIAHERGFAPKETGYVSHFINCSHANDFSKGKNPK